MDSTHIWAESPICITPIIIASIKKKGTKRVRSVTGTFQYNTKCLEPTMIVAVNESASEQAVPTQNTVKKCDMLVDYL